MKSKSFIVESVCGNKTDKIKQKEERKRKEQIPLNTERKIGKKTALNNWETKKALERNYIYFLRVIRTINSLFVSSLDNS